MNSVKDDPISLPRRHIPALIGNAVAVVLCMAMAGASPIVHAQVRQQVRHAPVAPVPEQRLELLPRPAESVELLHDEIASAPVAHIVWMEVTAYCACTKCCGPNAQGLTASGKEVTYNNGVFVAADTDLFPFGTRLSVPGYNGSQPVEVIDRGSAIKGHHLDIFFPTHDQAVQWGRRRLPVTVSE